MKIHQSSTERVPGSTTSESVQDRILETIAGCADENMRSLLVLFHAGFEDLGNKIDAMLSDEVALKEIVLNGITDGHAQDHLDWRAFKATRPNGKCPYVVLMEKRDEENRLDRRRISSNITERVLWLVVGALATFVVLGVKGSIGL